MSTNPDLRECRIDKTQAALVEFVAEIKKAFEVNEKDHNKIPVCATVDWARNILRSSQDVHSTDPERQALLNDLRGFVKEVRKVFTKHEDDLNDIPFNSMVDGAKVLLDRSGYQEAVVRPPSPRRSTP